MSKTEPSAAIQIREIDPASESEIDVVARRMQATLIEVEGEMVGTTLYSLEWLRDRVRWHLTNESVQATVLVATGRDGEIVAHTIVRVEEGTDGRAYGLISTTYVIPTWRGLGVATELLEAAETWFADLHLSLFSTWTSSTNSKLIKLYEKHGYSITDSHKHATGTLMVRLSKDALCS